MMSSPSRFQHELLLEHIDNDEGDTMRLRNPAGMDTLSPGMALQHRHPPSANHQEVAVLDALTQ